WHEMVSHAYDDTAALMIRLIEDGHDVTMLTNFASDTFKEARKRFGFLNKPRGVTVSGEIGLIKPDRAIYERHAADFGLDPAVTLFIDDSARNVQGAIDAGWRGIQYVDPAQLKSDLARLGVLALNDNH